MPKNSPPSSPVGVQGLTNFVALSVWEVAHRWHGMDPNTSDPKNLPLPVQDTLRALCKDLVEQAIPASNQMGDDFGTLSTGPRYDEWQSRATSAELHQGYEVAVADYTREHRE